MATWLDFLLAVRRSYWTSGTPSAAQQYRAIADYAHSIFVRQIESDIPLAKGFMDSYIVAKMALAGSLITDTLPNVTAAVLAILPVDADTIGGEAILANAIAQAVDDFNGTSQRFDADVANAAMDLQRHVPFYQGRHESVFLWNTAGLDNFGFVSRVPLPADFRIQAVWAGRYFFPLAEQVAYNVDDILESNGRRYRVLTAGSLNVGEMGNGLVSTDPCQVETLGSMEFEYHHGTKLVPVRKMPWGNREILFDGHFRGGPQYTVSPQFDSLWLYPSLIDDRQFFMLEWSGVKTTWQDTDTVYFDLLAQQIAAQYVRGMLAKDAIGDPKTAQSAFQLYQALLRKAVIDNQARATGTTSTTSELLYANLGRAPWWMWARMKHRHCQSNLNDNSGIDLVNDPATAGGVSTIYSQAHNLFAQVTFTGGATPRTIVLDPSKSQRGDRIVVPAIFPTTAMISITFRTGTVTGTILDTYTTDGSITSGVWEFEFDGVNWRYLRAQVPA